MTFDGAVREVWRLDGKVAVITGASRGIGRATALEMARRGAAVVVTARTVEKCHAVVDAIEAEGGRVEAAACHVERYTDVENLVKQAHDRFGRLDILVNNAGVIEPIGRLEACEPERWAQNIQVNLLGVFHGCRAVLPIFRQSGRGVIVNLSSGAAHKPMGGWGAYCTSKAAVAMLTQTVDLEASGVGVRVYGFQPGRVDTEMQRSIRASGVNEVSRVRREQLDDPHIPARIIAWLCTEDASDLAGKELSIRDGDIRRRAGLEATT